MKLLIFGATGGTGRQFVEQALEQGHTVTTFVRNPANFDNKHANLQIVQGDVMEFASVEPAVKNQDVVLSTIGAPASSKNTVRSEGTQNIIRAMEKAGLKRFISVSTFGVGDSREMLPFLYKYILVPLFLRHAFADHEVQENHIKQSRLRLDNRSPDSLNKRQPRRRISARLSTSRKESQKQNLPRRCRRFCVKAVDGRYLYSQNTGIVVLNRGNVRWNGDVEQSMDARAKQRHCYRGVWFPKLAWFITASGASCS